jgi:kynurenine formamidase
MWNGRDPNEEISFNGSRWAGIDKWGDGIVTRGILLDVPGHRGTSYVGVDDPVQGEELQEIANKLGVQLSPGDAIAVYSGRDRWESSGRFWGADHTEDGRPLHAGLHASCLEFLRDNDAAVLAWDMLDATPNEWGLSFTVHGAIFSFGMALIDHCDLAPLALACAEEGRYAFMLVVAPLVVRGGTGSPVNPLALL